MTDARLPWIPRFDYGDSTVTFTYPVTRWVPGARTEGTSFTSITGIPGPSLRLRKYTLGLTLRFLETEWRKVTDLLSVVQYGDRFTWFPRALDDSVAESVDVWLESPRVNENVKPTRDSSMLDLFTVPIVLARTSAPWDVPYFPTSTES